MHKILEQNRAVKVVQGHWFEKFLFGVVFYRWQRHLSRQLELERIIEEPLEVAGIHRIGQGNLNFFRLVFACIFGAGFQNAVQLVADGAERKQFFVRPVFVKMDFLFVKGGFIGNLAFGNKELQIPNHRRREKFFVLFQVPVDVTDVEPVGSAHQLAQEGIAVLVDRSVVTRPARCLGAQIHGVRFLLPREYACVCAEEKDMPCRNDPVDGEAHKGEAAAEKPRVSGMGILAGARKHLSRNFPRNPGRPCIELEFHQVDCILHPLPNLLFDGKSVFLGVQRHPMRQMRFQGRKRIRLMGFDTLRRKTNPAVKFINAADELHGKSVVRRFDIFVGQVALMGRGKRGVGHLRKKHLVDASAPVIFGTFAGMAVNVHVHHPFFPGSHIAVGNLQRRLDHGIFHEVKERRPRNRALLVNIQKICDGLANQGILFRVVCNRVGNIKLAIARGRIEHLFNGGAIRIKLGRDYHHFVEAYALL